MRLLTAGPETVDVPVTRILRTARLVIHGWWAAARHQRRQSDTSCSSANHRMTSTLNPTVPAAQTLPGTDTIDALIDQACRTLRLPTICDRHNEIAASSLRQQASYQTFLLELLETEIRAPR